MCVSKLIASAQEVLPVLAMVQGVTTINQAMQPMLHTAHEVFIYYWTNQTEPTPESEPSCSADSMSSVLAAHTLLCMPMPCQ